MIADTLQENWWGRQGCVHVQWQVLRAAQGSRILQAQASESLVEGNDKISFQTPSDLSDILYLQRCLQTLFLGNFKPE